MTGKDFYAVLGIPKTADEKTIKRAFRKLAKQYHPDTNQGNAAAEQKFKEVNEAYDILGDPKKRALYDKYGAIAFQEGFDPKAYEAYRSYRGSGADTAFRGQDGGYQEFHFTGDPGDLGDLFSQMFGANAGAFRTGAGAGAFHMGGDPFSGGRSGRSMKGADLEAEISLSFEEAAFGGEKRISFTQEGGRQTSLQVHIPAGIDEGQKIRLRGKGAPGRGSGLAGDLLLKVHILEKPGFARRGQDVYVTTQIPFPTAVLGGEVIVPTLSGNVSCRIPAGTQSGSKIRLRGKGIVSMKKAESFGDQYVIVQIQVPKSLTAQQKQKLREFAQSCESSPSQNPPRSGRGHAA